MAEGQAKKEMEQSPARARATVSDAYERTSEEGSSQAQRGRRMSIAQPRPRSGFERAASAIRTVVPIVQKVLPLVDGNVASVLANLLAPRLQAPNVDVSPIENSVDSLRSDLALLQKKNVEHDRVFQRMEEQLELLKETAERQGHEQKNLVDEVAKMRSRVLAFSVIGLVLLLACVGLDVALFVSVGTGAH